MLVFSRKRGEKVILEDGFTVTVLDVAGEQVELALSRQSAEADLSVAAESQNIRGSGPSAEIGFLGGIQEPSVIEHPQSVEIYPPALWAAECA